MEVYIKNANIFPDEAFWNDEISQSNNEKGYKHR